MRSQCHSAARTCDVVVLIDKIWCQFIHDRVKRAWSKAAAAYGEVSAGMNKFVSANVGHDPVTRYWSGLQSISRSQSVPREEVLPNE